MTESTPDVAASSDTSACAQQPPARRCPAPSPTSLPARALLHRQPAPALLPPPHLQPSPTCVCTLFPLYFSKVDLQLPSNPSARRFLQRLSYLCLLCIGEVSSRAPALRVAEAVLDAADAGECQVHSATGERTAPTGSAPVGRRHAREISRRLVPIMRQHG